MHLTTARVKHQLLSFLLVLGCIEVVSKLDVDAVDVIDIFFQLPHALSCVQGWTCVPLNPIDVNVVVLSHLHSEEVGLYGNAAVGSDLGSLGPVTEASATTSLVASSITAIASSSLSATSPSLVVVSAITTISRSLVVITSSSILLAASTTALVIVPIHLIRGLNLKFKKDINNKWTRYSCLKNNSLNSIFVET